jgi:hypothetical protein
MPEASLVIGGLKRLPLLARFALSQDTCGPIAFHAGRAVDWLVHSEAVTGGRGFAHSLHFARGWLPGYPETSGYIVPTLLIAAQRYGRPDAEAAALRAWDWLVAAQNPDGSFADLAGQSQAFDTGQILIGANFLARRGQQTAREVALKAAGWLARQQAETGCFEASSYNNRPHAYYSRVGAALVDTGDWSGNTSYRDSGIRNLAWTMAQQDRVNGWFQRMSFADHAPFSHTMIYTLEGLLAGYRFTGEQTYLDSVLLCAASLSEAIARHGGVIRSQYQEGFQALDDQVCVTGLSQWSALCFRLVRLGHPQFAQQAQSSLAAARRLQIQSSSRDIGGALQGSVPLSGRYMRFALPNWGVKFFLDALLEAEDASDLPYLI